MKNHFFKKLSFVMALAMIISVVSPAAGVFAATAKASLNKTTKYLHLDKNLDNEFDFNIRNKQSGWKYKWYSQNEKIATVDSKGITVAQGVGTTKIYVKITDKNNKLVRELSAKVIVRDNIKSLTITNTPAGDKLEVGQKNDFNRSYVTFAGSKTKTSGITRWTVSPSDTATIDDKGIFVATKAGEYTITANAFQSNAKYQDWLKDDVKFAANVTATTTYKVTVAATMKVDQVSLTEAKVTFSSPMEDVAKNVNLYQLVGTTKVKQVIKEVKMSADKKEATLVAYTPFKAEATFVVEYPEMEDVSFVAVTSKPEDVASIEITKGEVVFGSPQKIEVKLSNKDGVNITAGTGLLNRVTYKQETTDMKSYVSGDMITIFNKGDQATVTVTYHTYKYDNSTGQEIGNAVATRVITGVDASKATITGVNAWTIVTDGNPNFDKVKQTLAAQDTGRRLFVRVSELKDGKTNNVNSKNNPERFDYEQSDRDIVIINYLGEIYGAKQGTVNIIVKYAETGTKTPVDSITITVAAKREETVLVADAHEFTLSNSSNNVNDQKVVNFKVLDQLNEEFSSFPMSVSRVGTTPADVIWTVDGKKITFSGAGATAGTYYLKVSGPNNKEVFITVNVKAPANQATPSRYGLEVSKNSVDMAAKANEVNKNVTAKLFGYDASGIKMVGVDLQSGTNGNFVFELTKPQTSGVISATGTLVLVSSVSGGTVVKEKTGTYIINAYENRVINGSTVKVPLDAAYITVTDSQVKPVLSKVKSPTYGTTIDPTNMSSILAAVNECFEFSLNGTTVTSDKIIGATVVMRGDQATVTKVQIVQNFSRGTGASDGTADLIHEIDLNQTIIKR